MSDDWKCPRCGGVYFGTALLEFFRDGEPVPFDDRLPGDAMRMTRECHNAVDGTRLEGLKRDCKWRGVVLDERTPK
jgi:hypothetical protein